MADKDVPPADLQPHINAIKDHLQELGKTLPRESIANLTVKFTDEHQMLICFPDPETGKIICK